MEKVRIGIIGIGNMGSGHAKSIAAGNCPEIELAAVCDINPERLEWAKENGYCVAGSGSLWTLISEGGEKLGLDVTEIPLDKQRIINNLEVGNPIICVMGPGVFTSTGHFIVMTGYENGKIKINDPNSYANSQKAWDYEDIYDQINNLWVIR